MARTGITDWTKTLAAMKGCRDAMIEIARSYPSRDPISREADWWVRDIDNLADIIAGNCELWWSNRG